MIDWYDQDQVHRTFCGESAENEDHLVPDSMEGSISYSSGYCRNKRRNGAVSGVSSTKQTSGSTKDVPDSNLEGHSDSDTKEEFSALGLDMDTWTDLPNLSTELIDGYNNGNDLDSFTEELINDLSDVPNLDAVRGTGTVQHDGDELFGNELADKESNMFIDCNWDNFGDFDDLDTFFRNNESIFGHEMIGSEDVFLSESADGISTTIKSIPFLDIPLYNDQPSDQSCSPSQFDEYFNGKENPLQKVKVDGQKELLRVQQKIEARGKDKLPGHLSGSWDHKGNQKQQVPSQTLDSSITTAALSCQPESLGHFCSSSQVLYNEYRYPPYVPAVPHVQADPKQNHPICVSESIYPNSLKYSNSIEKLSDLSRSVAMTPEGKIEKLRRRQQMQAMIAIQQQKHHYSCHVNGTEDATSQACPGKSQNQDAITNIIGIEQCGNNLPSLEKCLFERKEGTERVSMLIDNNSLEETVYYQLQDSLEKLDVRVRLCIRDSLYRLARSATERQSTSDRSSTNKSIRDGDKAIAGAETSKQDRSEGLQDPETGTNHIDRIVAHLLFHKPSESCKYYQIESRMIPS